MNDSPDEALLERPRDLVRLATSPAIWILHFLLTYITSAIWCARVAGAGGSLGGVRPAIAGYTIVALVGILLVGRSGYRRHRHGTETGPHDLDSAADRHRFLGFVTMLLAVLSALATGYAAMPAFFLHTCH